MICILILRNHRNVREKVESLSNRIFLELSFPSGVTYDSFLDLECGLGHMTNLMNLKNQQMGGRL